MYWSLSLRTITERTSKIFRLAMGFVSCDTIDVMKFVIFNSTMSESASIARDSDSFSYVPFIIVSKTFTIAISELVWNSFDGVSTGLATWDFLSSETILERVLIIDDSMLGFVSETMYNINFVTLFWKSFSWSVPLEVIVVKIFRIFDLISLTAFSESLLSSVLSLVKWRLLPLISSEVFVLVSSDS